MGAVHQMGIDPPRGGGGGVAQGLPDVEQGGPLTGGDGGKGVPQAVEGEAGQAVFPHKPGEGQGEGVWGVGRPLVIQDHMVRPVEDSALPGPFLFLPLLLPPQQEEDLLREVEGAHRGPVLGLLLDDGGPIGGAGLPHQDQAAAEVHVLPLQAADLLPAHPQAARHLHRQLQNVPLDKLIELFQFLIVIKEGLLDPGPRRLHPVHGRGQKHILPHRGAQGAGEKVVVPPHGVGGQPGRLLGVRVVPLDPLG